MSRERAIRAFRIRLAELLRKEERCPACAKAKRLAQGTILCQVCPAHQRARYDIAFGGRDS